MFDAKRFNAAIALRGETRAEAAKVMKIDPSTLFRKTSGESDFKIGEIERFCEHYNVNPSDIFFAKEYA